MPNFSKFSLGNLATCHDDLQILFKKIIKDFDCRVLEGHRDLPTQRDFYKQGRTTPGPIITNVDGITKKSAHNYEPSRAVHVMPYPVDWRNRDRNAVFAGWVLGTARQMEIGIRWGGDWNGNTILTDQTLHDWVHYELI